MVWGGWWVLDYYSAIEYIDVPHVFPLLVLRLIGNYGGNINNK